MAAADELLASHVAKLRRHVIVAVHRSFDTTNQET